MSLSLQEVAKRVNWYANPSLLLADVDLFLCQVMARGSSDDIVIVRQQYSDDDLRKAFINAPAGLFNKRAWAYWGLVLLNNGEIPMPERFRGANLFDWRNAT